MIESSNIVGDFHFLTKSVVGRREVIFHISLSSLTIFTNEYNLKL